MRLRRHKEMQASSSPGSQPRRRQLEAGQRRLCVLAVVGRLLHLMSLHSARCGPCSQRRRIVVKELWLLMGQRRSERQLAVARRLELQTKQYMVLRVQPRQLLACMLAIPRLT